MSRFKPNDHAMYDDGHGKQVEVVVQAAIGTPDRRRYLCSPVNESGTVNHTARFTATGDELTKMPVVHV